MERPAILQANRVSARTGHIPAAAYTIDVLGPLDVRHAGNAITLPPRRRGLLALLALRAGTLVTPEQLVDGLWGDDAPPTAVRTLHAHIAKIGAVMSEFAPGRPIRRRDPGYVLDAQAVQVDRDRFEELTATGLRRFAEARYGEAAHRLGAGLELWRGAALSGCPVHGWAAAEAAYLEELRLQAYEGVFAARLASGARAEAGEIRRLVAEHPLRERLWELLIVALQVSGRSGEALAAYQRARRTLIDELGIEPGEGLRHAEAAVLRGIRQPLRLLRLAPSAVPNTAPAAMAGMRYQLPETIRGHVLAELAARPDEHARARRAHAACCLRRAEEAERRLQGPDLGPIMKEIAEQHEEMRTAMEWLTHDDPQAALRLASALWRYHYLRGRYGEGRDWLRCALAAAGDDVPGTMLAKARWAAARLAALECDYPEADALARSAMELYAAAGDGDGVARCQVLLCAVLRELGDYGQAIAFGRLALTAAEQRGDTWAAGNALQMLAFASWLSGDFAAATRLSTRAIRVLTPLGDRERLAWCRLDLGAAALHDGKTEAASRHLAQALLVFLQVRFKEGIAWAENLLALVDLRRGLTESALRRLVTSLRLHHELGDRWRQASVLDALAETAARLGEHAFAAELLGAAARIRTEIGAPVPACELPSHARTTALLRQTPASMPEADERGADLGVEDIHHQVTRLLGRRSRQAAPA